MRCNVLKNCCCPSEINNSANVFRTSYPQAVIAQQDGQTNVNNQVVYSINAINDRCISYTSAINMNNQVLSKNDTLPTYEDAIKSRI